MQADLGVIPEESAAYIQRSSLEVQVDPGALADATGQNGVSVPGLVAAFRDEMKAPEHAQFVHWGATSQDIIDTGLMLRMRQLLGLLEQDLHSLLNALSKQASLHTSTPMAARTWGQHATVTSFGAQVADWGNPLVDLVEELPTLRDSTLWVSLSGAAGTSNALGPQAVETRAGLAKGLGLKDPGRSWHADRGPVLRLAGWMARLSAALGKFGEDLTLLTQTGIGEVALGAAGSSSTMPQKQNPVGPAVIVALARHVAGLSATLHGAGQHRQQRDGAAWFTEWLVLPQLCLSTASALKHGVALAETLAPAPDAMSQALSSELDLIHAEALSFALAKIMPRPDAQAATKALCREAVTNGVQLAQLAVRDWPDLNTQDLFDATAQMGQAPHQAQAFGARVDNLKN